jgi:prepilin-type N-terminal cleavage/methylation domain-containing protein
VSGTVSRQRGETLIELMLALAITGLVLAGLAGVTYTVSDRFEHWAERITAASAGSAVAATVQADSHRYVPCTVPAAGQAQLVLCSPLDCRPAVTYAARATSGAYLLVRRERATEIPLARGNQPLVVSVSGRQGPEDEFGRIDLSGAGVEALSVPYRAPRRSCG